MDFSINYQVLNVFSNEEGGYGNPLAIVHEDEKVLTQAHRQLVAKKIGFSETAFLYDLETGSVTLFNPIAEVAFSGHALLGVAWYINQITKHVPKTLRCGGAEIETYQQDNLTWLRASTDILPDWQLIQMEQADDVESISLHNQPFSEHTLVWAWMNTLTGLIRARTFAPDWGIIEDEANGSGVMLLADVLGKDIQVQHGEGSIIFARPGDKGVVDLGGRVVKKEVVMVKL